jgi:hypothetical protein
MASTNKTRRNAFGRAFEVFGAAIAATAAIQNHRRPEKRHLDVLGMDAKAFEHLK